MSAKHSKTSHHAPGGVQVEIGVEVLLHTVDLLAGHIADVDEDRERLVGRVAERLIRFGLWRLDAARRRCQ
jgi:hypothetical protein